MCNRNRFPGVGDPALAEAGKVNRHGNQCSSYYSSCPEFSFHRDLASTTRGVAG
jgi:hypothetical protein